MNQIVLDMPVCRHCESEEVGNLFCNACGQMQIRAGDDPDNDGYEDNKDERIASGYEQQREDAAANYQD